MENRTRFHSSPEWLMAELARQIEAYDQSLINDEIFEVRKEIATRIVEIERNLVAMKKAPQGYQTISYSYLYN